MELSEGTKRFYERVQNPLWLDPILDLVFTFLPKSALAECRLVCRHWRDLSERHFITRNRQHPSTINLPDSSSTLSFLSTFVQRDLDLTRRPDRSLWTSFRLDLFDVCPIQRQLFVNTCGDSIQRISISPRICMDIVGLLDMLMRSTPRLESLEFSCIIANEQMIEYASLNPGNQGLPDFFRWFENLKNSTRSIFTALHRLRLRIYVEEDALDDTARFFSALFQLMPHLQDLRLFDLDVGKPWLKDRIIPAIIDALQQQKPHNFMGQLVYLQLPYLDTTDVHHLHQFRMNHSLQMKSAWLVSFRERVDSQTILTFLKGQAATLKKLYLTSFTAGLFLDFPLGLTLTGVSTLVLIHVDAVFVPGILIHFPNLTTLVIRRATADEIGSTLYSPRPFASMMDIMEQQRFRMVSVSSNGLVGEKVTTLRFCYYQDMCNLSILDRLSNSCPNVVDLELKFVSIEDVRLVFDRWHRLRRLVIRFFSWTQKEGLMDSYFTGVNCGDNLSKTKASCPATFPSLILLQDLRTLEIQVDDEFPGSKRSCRHMPNSMFVSDNTVLTVLIRLPQLRELTINQSSISASCLRTLNKALNLEKCLVCDKVGQVIDFKSQSHDLVTEYCKGKKVGRFPASRVTKKQGQRHRRPFPRPGHESLSQYFPRKTCCLIV